MKRIDPATIENLLALVQKPARYIGRELNVIVKDDVRFHMALSYPDLYEIGMVNNGVRILYDIVNALPDAACERVFAVAADFEHALRGSGVPLYTLETYTPLNELDILGFNISHELLCTNILQILDLGGIPLLRRDRKDGDPIVIAGGEAVSNPFPMGDFIDAFFIGDGEEGIVEIVRAGLSARAEGLGRDETLQSLGAVEGVLLPKQYTFSYNGCSIVEKKGPSVRKRVYHGDDLRDPVKPVVPNIRIAQERIVVEVTRGCSNFCSFCHAGFYDLPYRCYDPEPLAGRIMEISRNTGYNEVTLSSLSISDYPKLANLVNALLPELTAKGISVSFPSLRIDTGTLPVIEQISELRRASLTFAVESASEQIRMRANKKVFHQDLVDIVRHVYERGWKVIKLYFMIGLPGCDEYDEAADIIGLLKEIYRIGGKGLDINVTISPFVPKPHTPFQWERQMGRDYFENTVLKIKKGLPRFIKIKNHDVRASVLEGVLARGDTRLGPVIEQVYRDGCRLDSWAEHFHPEIWEKHLEALLPGWTEYLDRREDGSLPWSFVVTGFEPLIERLRAGNLAGENESSRNVRRHEPIDAGLIEKAKERFTRTYEVKKRMRLKLAKTGMMRFIPHLDFMEIVKRSLRMAEAPVAMTQGFNKRERMSAGYPLPLGIESESEMIDVELFDDAGDDLRDRMNVRLPRGISVLDAHYIEEWISIMAITAVVEYRVTFSDADQRSTVNANLGRRGDFIKHTKKSERTIPFATVVHSFDFQDDGRFVLKLFAGSEDSVRIDDVIKMLADIDALDGIRIVKTAQYRLKDGVLNLVV